MAHVRCPKCERLLKLRDTEGTVHARCPSCGFAFRVAPAPSEPDGPHEAGLGWFAKGALASLALLGTCLLGFLLYSVARPRPKADAPSDAVGTPARRATTARGKLSPEEEAAALWQAMSPEKKARLISEARAAKGAPEGRVKALRPIVATMPVQPKPGQQLSPKELFAAASPAVVQVLVRDENFKLIGQGSGFFVAADGLLVTNQHVIRGGRFATVKLSSNAWLLVDSVLAVDPNADLALLKVNGTALPFLKLSDGKLPDVGMRVYAIGNPHGLTNTLSEGLVSGIRRDERGQFVQTTAPISEGSSGGPLLAEDGKVVGVTTSSRPGAQNLNFAAPAPAVARLLNHPRHPQTLASAGGNRLDKTATEQLSQAWDAIAKEDWSGAAKLLAELRKTDRDNPSVCYALGCLHHRLGNFEIAIQHYKSGIAIRPTRLLYSGLGNAYWRMGRHGDAAIAFETEIRMTRNAGETPSFLIYMALAHNYEGSGQYEEAVKAYQLALRVGPEPFMTASSYSVIRASVYSSMGEAYTKLRQYPEAVAAFQEAIKRGLTGASGYFALAEAYRHWGKRAEAIEAYKAAAEADSADGEVARKSDAHIAALRWGLGR